MFLLINSLLVLLNGGFQFFVLSLFLTPKRNRIQNTLLYCLLLYISVFFKCAAIKPLVSAFFALCSTLTLFCYTIITFKNSFWEKFGKCVLMLGLLSLTAEASFSALLKYGLHIIPSMDYYSESMILPLLILNVLTILLCPLFIFLMKLIERIKRKRRLGSIVLFIFIQLVAPTILFIMYSSDISAGNLHFSLIAPIILFIANLFLFLSVINQEEKAVAQTAYRELQTLYRIEEEHYHELEQHSEALAKIRHDFNNQLATIHMLLQNKNYSDAKDMARHMKELLDSVSSSVSDCS